MSAVAPPLVMVSRGTEGVVKLFSTQNFRCDVIVIEEVDTSYVVDIQWIPVYNETNILTSNTSGHNGSYYSVLNILEFRVTDAGNYTCIATVASTETKMGISNETVSRTDMAHISTG